MNIQENILKKGVKEINNRYTIYPQNCICLIVKKCSYLCLTGILELIELFMELILNLETSMDICSVCLSENGKIIDLVESDEERTHASSLTVFIEDMLSRNKLKMKDLKAVAVSKGPGSYTGLRIGVSVAKGLCYGANLPLLSVNTLQAMALGGQLYYDKKGELDKNTWFCPMIDARRLEVYCCFFDFSNVPQNDIRAEIITNDSFKEILEQRKVLFFGNGAPKCKSLIQHKNALFIEDFKHSSKFMIPLAEKAFHESRFEDVAYFEPFYLKDFIATIPKKLF